MNQNIYQGSRYKDQFLTNSHEKVSSKHCNDAKAFAEYSNDMDE